MKGGVGTRTRNRYGDHYTAGGISSKGYKHYECMMLRKVYAGKWVRGLKGGVGTRTRDRYGDHYTADGMAPYGRQYHGSKPLRKL